MTNWKRSALTYCSNVHPGSTLEELIEVLHKHITGVRVIRGLNAMGSGLWISARIAQQLLTVPGLLDYFTEQLSENRVDLFTLNGFPFGDFHAARVKELVYQPDWSSPKRLEYTLNLAQILSRCLPPDYTEGTISTLPLGFAPEWNRTKQEHALAALCKITKALSELYEQTGRRIRVCLEMEPGCVLENTAQAIALFSEELPSVAVSHGVSNEQIAAHLGLCYDICHQAVMFEKPADSLSRISRAGITVGKIQISSALELTQPSEPEQKRLLEEYAEPRYLHQVRTRAQGNELVGVMDLPEALRESRLSVEASWRIHFHIPIQTTSVYQGKLATTQEEITAVLNYLSEHPEMHPHLEVETYTWQVLPHVLRPTNAQALQQGLAMELNWLEKEMLVRGLLDDTRQ